MKSYDAYIFDLYGTLIDIHTDESSMAFWHKIRELFRMYGADYDAKELKNIYFETIRKQEDRKTENDHLVEIEISIVFQEMFKRKGAALNEKQLHEVAWHFRRDSTTHLRLYAGAVELLKTLRSSGSRIFLLSNAQTLFTLPELQQSGLDQLFDDIVISSAVGYRKPDTAFFQFLLRKHYLLPENCLMVGNDLYTDIAGAQATGMDSYYIHSALSPKNEISDIVPTYRQNKMDLKRLRHILMNFT
jgi:putative hydrolase of the HAD superfamily